MGTHMRRCITRRVRVHNVIVNKDAHQKFLADTNIHWTTARGRRCHAHITSRKRHRHEMEKESRTESSGVSQAMQKKEVNGTQNNLECSLWLFKHPLLHICSTDRPANALNQGILCRKASIVDRLRPKTLDRTNKKTHQANSKSRNNNNAV